MGGSFEMQMLTIAWGVLRRWSVQLGPMVLIEIVLPGGTLIVTLLLLYRRWKAGASVADGDSFLAALARLPVRTATADLHNVRFSSRPPQSCRT